MIVCECGAVISDGVIIKNISVIQISKDKKLLNIKCRKCKKWHERISVDTLLGGNK